MCEFFVLFSLKYCWCACACQSSAIMIYFMDYTSWPSGFDLILFQKTQWNEMKKKNERKKKLSEKLEHENINKKKN